MREELAEGDGIQGGVKGRVTDGVPRGSITGLIPVVITDVPQ